MRKYFFPRICPLFLSVFFIFAFSTVQAANSLDTILSIHNSFIDNFPDSSLQIAREAYNRGNNGVKLKALLISGKAYLINGDYLAAQQALQEGLLLLKTIDQQKIHGDYYLAVGKLFNMKRHYGESFNYYNMALLTYQQLNLPDEEAYAKLGLVELYRKLEEYRKAEKLLKEIKEALQPASPGYVWAEYYNRKAAIFNEKVGSTRIVSYLDSSQKYTLLALEVAEKIDNRHLEAISLNELGFNYENQLMLSAAYAYYEKAEKIWDELRYPRYLCHVKNNLGRVLSRQQKYEESNQKIMEQLPLAEKRDWKDIMVYAYYYLANNHEHLKDYKRAAEFWRRYAEQSIITLREEKSNEIREVEEKHELKEKEKLLAQRNEKRAGSGKSGYIIWSATGVLLVIILFFIRRRLLGKQTPSS